MTNAYASSILRKTLGHASRSKKPQNPNRWAKFLKIRNLQKPKPLVFILFALLLCCSAAWGQLSEWELQGSGEYKVTQDQLFSNISVSGSLILHVEENVKFKASTFNNGSKAMFKVDGGGSLTIYGNGKLTIDGQQNVTSIVNEGANNSGNSATAFACTSGANAKTQLIVKDVTIKNYVSNAVSGNNGVINFSGSNDQKLSEALLENVTIEDCYAGYANNDQNKPDLSGHPLYIYGRVVSIVNGAWDITMDHVTIRNCYVMEPEENYQWIDNMGGLIRSQGGHAGQLKCKSCTFENNTYYDRWRTTNMNNPYLVGQGGAINWRSGGQFSADASHETKLIIEDCTFKENRAKRGGAIATNATMEIKNSASDKTTVFEKNEAELGGALYFWTYNGGQRAYDGRGFDIELGMDATSVIEVKNNYASKMGGGVYITIDPSHDIGFNASNVAIDAGFSVQAGAGAKIEKNRSPKGAGVAIIDNAALRHKIIDYPSYIDQVGHPTAGSWSGKYSRTVTFTGATVKGNYTSKRIGTDSWTTDEEAAGGGVYIVKKKFVSDEPAFAFDDDFKVDSYTGAIALGEGEAHGGTMTVDVLLGDYSGNSAQKYKFSTLSDDPQNDVLDDNNNKGNGGGFYIASLFEITDFKSYLNVNIGASNKVPEIYNNKATTHGGGIYIYYDRENGRDNGGNVNVLNGYIGKTQLATNNALNGNGGGLCVLGGTVTIGGGHVLYNTAANGLGGGIYVNVANESSITYINASTSGGTIGANISYNSALGGGGIYVDKGKLEVDGPTFGSGTYDPATDNTHTRITKNKATDGNGGGIDAGNGEVNITNALIYNNDAEGSTEDKGNGGGIYLDGGTIEINTSKILYDTAQISGGGICVVGGSVDMKSGDVGNNNAQNNYGGGICVLGGTVLVEGGNILSNTAKELGGGVYVSVPNATTTTTIRGGANISSNTAKGGGGVYVDKGLLTVYGPVFDSEYVYPIDPVTGNVNASYNPAAETHTRITNNWATDGNGGGIDAGNGTVEITNTLIYNNEARGTVSKGRGGGVYLDGGTIDITTSKILKNTAETNGGGIDDHSGDIDIYGGDISHNKATTGRGGGIYTNAGDILIWPSAMKDNLSASLEDCKNTGTLFSYNTAGTNGGGLNTHIGRLDVRFANVHHNVAGTTYGSNGQGPDGNGATGTGGSGGGMFCEGPHANLSGYTVRLIHDSLNDNRAYGNGGSEDNLTGRGGGLYLKYGSVFAEHCGILRNEADINGGGLDNHDGELRVYGSYVDHNKAKTGRGGGLYTDKGNLVLGPCDTYGYDNSKASRITYNEAGTNGGGINNHEGAIIIHGDKINHNKALTGKGGGIYINSGSINMYGGQINHNQANDPSGGYGGGVYGGGGKFKIEERVPNPIVEILEIDTIKTDKITVHYHLVDRGLAPIENYPLTHGIAYSTRKPTIENPWVAADTTMVTYNGGSGQSFVSFEGCVRVSSKTSLTPNTTYYVIAWAKYIENEGEEDEKVYYDASPIDSVTTHGNQPVVVTGVAFDITANSASVNGKLFYEGTGSGEVTKGFRYKTGSNDWTNVTSSSTGNVFSVTLTGLNPGTTYQAQPYATKGGYTGYGDVITFTTASGRAMGDAGNTPSSTYPAVEENPFFQELTPLQQAILASTPEGDSITLSGKQGRPTIDGPVDIPEICYNTATYGGGICIDKQGAELIFAGSESEAKKGKINVNYASEAGGGIYIGYETNDDPAKSGPAMMQMMDKCEVNYNYVPTGKLGGGIYLDGRLYVGENDTDPNTRHGLRVDRNFTSDIDTTEWMHYPWTPEYNPGSSSKLNNVFLPRSEYDYDDHSDAATPDIYNKISVITLLSDLSGKDASNRYYSHIGFSVLKGFCPVIATAKEFGGGYKVHDDFTGATPEVGSEEWLYKLMNLAGEGGGDDQTVEAMRGAVFEDSESYVAVHTRGDMPPFRMKYIYLWGCWTHPIVNEDPERNTGHEAGLEENDQSMVGTGKHYKITKEDNILTWEIYSPEGLSWFTSYVNGLNAFDEKTGDSDNDDKHAAWKENINPYANAKIMNDLDMSAYLWVPIGSVQKFYKSALTEQGSLFVDSETQVMKEQVKTDPVTGDTIKDPITGEPVMEWVEDFDYSNNKHYYRGTFDGQGHIIKGLQGLYLTGIEKFGLFGYLADSAVVKNTFVDEGLFVSDNVDVVYSAGGIAGTMQNNAGKVPVISNSEARMNMNVGHCDYGTNLGGLVGEMKAGTIHSCMAMPTMMGQLKGFEGDKPRVKAFEGSMGGLVGKLGNNCSLKNSFANVMLTLVETEGTTIEAGANTRFLGGIVGHNSGTIENVYVRYNNATNTPDLDNGKFYWIAGNNAAAASNIKYCFTPSGKTGQGQWWYAAGTGATLRRTYDATSRVDGKYGFAHQDQQITSFKPANQSPDPATYIVNGPIDNEGNLKGLLASLNAWVTANSGYTPWTRTMASAINSDYPVLMFDDFNVVGSEDSIYMKYDTCVNNMWKAPNYESLAVAERNGKNFQSLTAALNPKAAMYLYNTNYDPISITNNTAVRLYIHENVGVTQTDGAELHARVGVTFDNSNKSLALGGKAYDWHMFSSALKAAPLGITYHSGNTNPNTGGKSYSIKNEFARLKTEGIIDDDDNYRSREYMDPPVTTWNTAPGTVGYFPTNTPYGQWGNGHWPSSDAFSNTEENPYSFDFYCFHEESRHWINFKREGTTEFMDHWHQDIDGSGKHQNLWYENESTLQVGKGYMMGVSAVSMLMADGILNNGVKSNENEPAGISSAEDLTNSDYAFNPSGYSEELRGTNLVGNPFQSYLNFNDLVSANPGIIHSNTYYLFDADKQRYISYTTSQADNEQYAPRVIHPHQGFFIKTAKDKAQLKFNNNMRAATGNEFSYFRGQNLNYPLVNLFCYDVDGFYDLTTVEMNRPELGGGEKLKDMRFGNSLLYASVAGTDYQVLFAPEGTSTVAVRFKASQDGVYTMRWETMHGDFHYLHLIDNMSGADVDMLRSEEYRFEATTTDYLSRFKLVFEVTDVEENPIEAEATTFAFCMGDELIVNGAGYLEVFDVQGRRLSAKRLVDAQSSVSLPNVAAGIYFLRLSDDKQVRTQKMVINY